MKKQKLLSDMINVAGGVLKSFEGAKDYSKMKFKNKITDVIEDMNFIKKNELSEIKAMLVKSRVEMDEINKRLSNIEKRVGSDKKGTSIQKNIEAIAEVDKNSEINSKEIELLKLQIREIQANSGNPLSN